jgi:hypothetical protein
VTERECDFRPTSENELAILSNAVLPHFELWF